MDIYAEITNRIMEQMENGVIPWRKPWVAAGSAISHATGKSYSLLNQMLLGRPGEYLTFKQVQAEGGQPKKFSPLVWTVPPFMSMPPHGLPTGGNLGLAVKWAFPPRSFMPGAPWVCGS